LGVETNEPSTRYYFIDRDTGNIAETFNNKTQKLVASYYGNIHRDKKIFDSLSF
jgi:hypothetical protein